MKKATKLSTAIAISLSFFFVELIIGIRQGSLALVADAFHIASDIIGFVIALVAVRLAEKRTGYPSTFSYGLQRAPTVGAFFNGCFLTGLGFAILLQSIERLITPEEVIDPKLVLIVGGVGLALNILAALVVHDHGDHGHSHDKPGAREEQQVSASIALQDIPDAHADHVHTTRVPKNKAGYDLGLLGAMIHLVGDALNSVAVMISAVIIWQAHWQRADGVASVVVSLMIVATAIPLLKRSGRLLLEIAPQGLDLKSVEKDIKSLK